MKEFTAVIESLDGLTKEVLLAIIAWKLGIARATMYRRLKQADAFDPHEWALIVGALNVHIRPITEITYTINQFTDEDLLPQGTSSGVPHHG